MKWLWLSGLVVVLDQITKLVADSQLVFHRPVAVFPGLSFTLLYNEGAAFSFLSDAGGWQRWFFMLLSLVISLVLILWLRSVDKHKLFLAAGIALILGGAVGNLIDRSLYGYVIDFIDVYYRQYHWPAFNLADSAITLGAALLIIDLLLERKTQQTLEKGRNGT
jgi:signal peptidase II